MNRRQKRKEKKRLKKTNTRTVHTCFSSGMGVQSPIIGFDGIQNSWGCLLQDRCGSGSIFGVYFPDSGCSDMV
jgi:hypothetical protein